MTKITMGHIEGWKCEERLHTDSVRFHFFGYEEHGPCFFSWLGSVHSLIYGTCAPNTNFCAYKLSLEVLRISVIQWTTEQGRTFNILAFKVNCSQDYLVLLLLNIKTIVKIDLLFTVAGRFYHIDISQGHNSMDKRISESV